jgi:hypothetical protein
MPPEGATHRPHPFHETERAAVPAPHPHPASLTESRLCAEHQLYLSEGLATLGFVCTRDI